MASCSLPCRCWLLIVAYSIQLLTPSHIYQRDHRALTFTTLLSSPSQIRPQPHSLSIFITQPPFLHSPRHPHSPQSPHNLSISPVPPSNKVWTHHAPIQRSVAPPVMLIKRRPTWQVFLLVPARRGIIPATSHSSQEQWDANFVSTLHTKKR